MPSYKAPVEEVLFLLQNVFPLQRYNNLSGFAEATPDIVEAIVLEAAKLCEETLQPLNQTGDRAGCVRNKDGSVATPAGFKEAYGAFVDGGWVGLAADPDFGGQGLPFTLAAIVNEFASSANMSFAMYPGLSQGALATLLTHGTEEQKRLFVPKLISGDWSGTMNLTESHCGTDLGLLKTKAVPNGDGSYAISGEKIFISAGEHDLAENIIHLVLARVEGAPAGVKGISMFVVPKMLIEQHGALAVPNKVACGSIEHKMGIHANATCVMNYDGAKGWLVGEPNKGLNAMFVMMNEARLGVAIQGLAVSEAAYQNAAAYAKERLQGRSLSGPKYP
jgi:acyl-CoA dehydrogenase